MSGFKTISLADQVFNKLEADIVSGKIKKGEILTELALVDQMNVSRTPIREALRRLQTERLIQETGRGNIVLGITLDDLEDIMAIRLNIEGLAAYYCTKNISEEGKNRLTEIVDLQEFYSLKDDLENLRKMDDEFHTTIYDNCKRCVLEDVLKPLHKKTQRYRKSSLQYRRKDSVIEHKKIYEAILSGNADEARELMTVHIEHAKHSIIERVKNNG